MSELVISMNDPMPQCSGCATLRQRVSELEAQVAEQVACRAALNRELIREQKRLKLRDAERDALQETVDRQLNQLAAANERVQDLEAQLAEARKDSKGLEKVLRGHRVECGIALDGRRYIDVAHRVGCYWIRKFISYGTTFSEAIDAAIEAAEKGSER